MRAVVVDHRDQSQVLGRVWTGAKGAYLMLHVATLAARPPFDDPAKREELRARLNGIPGVTIPPDAVDRYPSIRSPVLRDEARQRALLDVLDWAAQEVRRS